MRLFLTKPSPLAQAASKTAPCRSLTSAALKISAPEQAGSKVTSKAALHLSATPVVTKTATRLSNATCPQSKHTDTNCTKKVSFLAPATSEATFLTPAASETALLATATPKAAVRRSLAQIAPKAARMALALLLASTMTMPLAGCKETDVLTETILDQNAEETDESLTPVRVEATTDNIDSTTDENKGESDGADDQIEDDPSYDDSADADGDTAQRLHADETTGQDNASEGTADSDSTGDGESSVSEADGSDNTSSGEGEGDGESSSLSEGSGSSSQSNNQSTSEVQGPGNTSQGSNSSGRGGSSGTLYDDNNGVYDELPDGSSIAARGELATLVAAIGGGSTLGCTSEEWLQTAQSKNVFLGELDSVQTAWSGDGSTSDTLDVDAVIASGVDVLLCASDEITDDQCEELNEAGIDVVAMPALGEVDTPDEYIETAAQVVGEILDNATGGTSSDMAEQYISMRTSALEVLYNDNSGYTTLTLYGESDNSIYQGTGTALSSVSSNKTVVSFIDGWIDSDEEVIEDYRQHYPIADFTFWPCLNGSSYLVSDSRYDDGVYISLKAYINVSDGYGLTSFLSGRYADSVSVYALFDYYLQLAGAMNVNRGSSSSYSAQLGSNPVSVLSRSLLISYTSGSSGNPILLGDEEYPALIVSDIEYAEKIASSAAKENGYYNVGQAYEVWVLPSGLDGSWAHGNMESYLSALWAAGKLDGDVNKYASYIKEFYSTFFRCDAAEVVENWDTTYEIAELPGMPDMKVQRTEANY